jgi:hypothetical protein
MEIEVNFLKPVPLGGATFIRVSFGIIAAKDGELVARYKNKLSKLLNDLLKELQEKFGKDALVAVNYELIVDDTTKEPKEIIIRKVTYWEPVKILTEPIIVENKPE